MSRSERNRGNRNSRKRREKGKKFKRDMRSFLKEFDIEQYLERAKSMDRRFILHVGPTNSGKTYDEYSVLRVPLIRDRIPSVAQSVPLTY